MKDSIIKSLSKVTKLSKKEISDLIEIPPDSKLGDYAFPCFILAKKQKKNPNKIAKLLANKIKSPKAIEKIESQGPYVNFFINSETLAKNTLKKVQKEGDKYGSTKIARNKKIVIDMSSPNIAKPFGIGHLRSTIIGNSIANISSFLGFNVIKINYLGDWGTPFGTIIAGYNKWGNEKELQNNPIKHLYELYVKASQDPGFDEESRNNFKKMEEGNKEIIALWKKFRKLSIEDFKKIYNFLGVEFDIFSGESVYNKKINSIIKELEKKALLERSNDALIIDLDKYDLGVGLIQKTDGTTLYLTRDIAAAKHRYSKYKFARMFYEVGLEQKLYFKQFFKILELMGHKWAKNCAHIDHGFYLDKDGKKFATRKGKTIFMEDIFKETKELAKREIQKRNHLKEKELEKRALAITRAAIIYGDLKNYRTNNMIFNISRFLSLEGNTGPYLLYTYARARSILRKANYKRKRHTIKSLNEKEKSLILELNKFPKVVMEAYKRLAPNLIANYAYQISQSFNEFYHSTKVIGSKDEPFKLAFVEAFSQVLKNALALLNIPVIEQM